MATTGRKVKIAVVERFCKRTAAIPPCSCRCQMAIPSGEPRGRHRNCRAGFESAPLPFFRAGTFILFFLTLDMHSDNGVGKCDYSEDDLRAAADAGVDLKRLMAFLAGRRPTALARGSAPFAVFDAAHLLWYAGALIVIDATGYFQPWRSPSWTAPRCPSALRLCHRLYNRGRSLFHQRPWRRFQA
jgi:hypothetical protein